MLTCRKHQFYLPPDAHYLNCAYMAPLSADVEKAGIAGLRKKRNPSHINPDDFFTDSKRARRLFGRLIHADPSSIALIPSVSYGMSTIAQNLKIERGGTIVLVEEQFPSNVYVWRRLAKNRGLEIITVTPGFSDRVPSPAEEGGRPDAMETSARRATRWNERILAAIDPSTAVVAMANVHWTDGTLFDLVAIGEKARQVGAALVVDGSQSVGALSFDVTKVQPDALICAGYKWLFGPYSLGVAYFAEVYHSGTPLEENWISRRHSERFSALVDYEEEYQPGSLRYDVGERSNFILVPMLCAALEHVLEWTPEAIQTYCSNLTSGLITEAREMGYRIEHETGRGSHLFGIRLPPFVEPERLRRELAARNVSVSIRGSAVRVSPHVYNDDADVAALKDALAAAAGSA